MHHVQRVPVQGMARPDGQTHGVALPLATGALRSREVRSAGHQVHVQHRAAGAVPVRTLPFLLQHVRLIHAALDVEHSRQ